MFGGGPDYENPADEAMPYLEEIPGTVEPMYDPYINLGKGAARVSAPIYYQRATDPNAAYNDLMSGYEESDSYKYNQEQLTKQQEADAAAGGYTGTYYDQQKQADTTSGLLSQDEQQYYKNNLGLQDSGLNAGMHYFDTGYTASDTLANLLAGNLAAEAGLEYQGTAFDNQMKAQQRQSRNYLAGSLAGGYFGSKQMSGGSSSGGSSDGYDAAMWEMM